MNILFGDKSCAKQLKLEKWGDALRYHPGIENLIKKDPVTNYQISAIVFFIFRLVD
jgi:hypothetical protein